MDLFGTAKSDSSSDDDDQDDEAIQQATQDGQPNTTIMSLTNPNAVGINTKEYQSTQEQDVA